MVGAVLLRNGRPIGEGFHAEFGGPHAEVSALAACSDAAGATCVVTLEPCRHEGKTPPCTEALIEARVGRVVVALPDPDPTAGGGVAGLRAAGIDVDVGLLASEAAALNAPFLWARRRPTPFVALKVATSLDGLLADARGSSRWVSGPEAREYVHWLRAGFDAIGVGRRTAEEDDPRLTARGHPEPRRPPRRVIFAREGPIANTWHLVREAERHPTMVIRVGGGDPGAIQASPGIPTIAAPSLEDALVQLRVDGVESLLIEGGGTLARAMLQEGLVDRVYWIQAPRWLGEGVAAFLPGAPHPLAEAPVWTVTERRALGTDTLLVVDRELCLPES